MTTAREEAVMKNLREAAEARGMTFYRHPARDVLPDFLRDFVPDALARGPNGGIVIQVRKGRPANPEGDRLSDIARMVSGHKGWEFRAVILDIPANEPPYIAPPAPGQLKPLLEEIAALAQAGFRTAAFLRAWSALEAMARLALEDPTKQPTSPAGAVQTLAELGYLDIDGEHRVRDLVRLRNAIAHGDLSAEVSAGQLQDLLDALQTIARELEQPAH
jgi:uncharacterized protein YutE (UPF0331/DUF86 family)